ncbi:hypothetical protein [Clostridium sp. KNHs205]|uniref:hypothetical protein n=1 Tax=Clostridium sp. KNHs205 TaxID=1449050 RepID=UPI00051B0B43|nr:hypothetical protein [Clostridium sp. KNHs205]
MGKVKSQDLDKYKDEELLPLRVLMDLLPWGSTKTWSMIRKGELPFLIKVGKSYFFYKSSYIEYFKSMEGREV